VFNEEGGQTRKGVYQGTAEEQAEKVTRKNVENGKVTHVKEKTVLEMREIRGTSLKEYFSWGKGRTEGTYVWYLGVE